VDEARPAEAQVRSVAPPRLCPAIAANVPTSPDFGDVRALVEDTLRWDGTPSLALAVSHRGTIVWEEGFGFADKARRVRATQDTMYSLASISKPFTATAVMLLAQEGKLDLSAPINTYLGETGVRAGVGDAAAATVERVASHTAGLPLHYRFFYGEAPPSYAETRARHAVLVTEPGERYRYSNLGFGLLEQVVAEVSGESYAQYMHAAVFKPLGLEHTEVGIPKRSRTRSVAVRYDGRGVPIADYGFDHDGASAIYSSAHDLVRFGLAQLGGGPQPLLDDTARKRMWTVVAPAPTYALGWSVRRADGSVRISHNGGMPGVRTTLILLPEHEIVVAVLINSSAGQHKNVAAAVLRAMGVPARADVICGLPEDDPWLGQYVGTLQSETGPQAFSLSILGDGRVQAQLGNTTLPLSGVTLGKDGLRGSAFGNVGASAAGSQDTELRFDLQLRGDRLTGAVSTLVRHTAATTMFVDLARAE